MNLSSLIQTASSGLRATQAGLDLVSQNVANAGTVGYTRRTLRTEQIIAGDRTTGVAVLGADRALDVLVQKQLRLETAGAAYTATKSGTHSRLDQLFGSTSSGSTLPALANAFASAVGALADDPASYSARAGVVAAAQNFAGSLNGLTGGVQSLRQDAENGLANAVRSANDILQEIAAIGVTIRSNSANPTSAAILDQRDGLIDQLSQYLDIKVTPGTGGNLTIATTGGLQLFDGVRQTSLSFDARSPLGPANAYSADPALRNVGTVTATDALGNKRDVLSLGLIRSGEIAAFVELRDEILPQVQEQLDAVAAGLASALSDKPVAGTAASAGAANGFVLDLASLQYGNTFTLTARQGGVERVVTFVKTGTSASAAAATSADGSTVGIDFWNGLVPIATQIQNALGPGFTVSNPSGMNIRILDDGAPNTTDVLGFQARPTVVGLSTGDAQLPLFVDDGNQPYTGSFESASQRVGFAGRIALNASVAADPALLVKYTASTLPADRLRPEFLREKLIGAAITVPGSAGLFGSVAVSDSLGGVANRIVALQATNANAASSLDKGQQVVLNAVRSRYSDQAGVNVDAELTQLIQLQTAYTANARVLAAGKEMLDLLMRIGA
jgi:flagellar hook-associated protein 1 FlgK